MSDKISMVIPCYWLNDELLEMTMQCINTLSETTDDEPSEVLLIDDGSPIGLDLNDETDLKQEVKVITKETNGGYASAVNCGLFYATGDIIIVCNNDIEFIQDGWLEHLLKPLSEGYAISSIRTTDADGWETEDKLEDNAKFGSIWAMKREVYDAIGGLDESFGKGYFEDLDYHRRVTEAGFKIAKNHAGLVEHKGQATFKQLNDDRIYNLAMLKYKEKWPDSILFVQEGTGIVLATSFDISKYGSAAKDKMRSTEIKPEEALRLWGYDAD